MSLHEVKKLSLTAGPTAVTHWNQWRICPFVANLSHSCLLVSVAVLTQWRWASAKWWEGNRRAERSGLIILPHSLGKQNGKIFAQTGSLAFPNDWKHVERGVHPLNPPPLACLCQHTHVHGVGSRANPTLILTSARWNVSAATKTPLMLLSWSCLQPR